MSPDDLTALHALTERIGLPGVDDGSRPRWRDVAQVLRSYAHDMLEAGDGTGLFVAAADGDIPLLLATGRSYEHGAYEAVVVELASLALGLGADRIAVAVTGRAWSIDDPIPPVSDDGDLRQRVLVVTAADGHDRDDAEVLGSVCPFELVDGEVHWGDVLSADDGEGWIPSALAVVVTQTASFVGRPDDLAAQFTRCESLGHQLELAPEGVVRVLAATAMNDDG